MSYITKKGQDALISATTEQKDFSKALGKFKDGSTYKVRVPNATSFVEYKAHSAYNVFYTTPCSGDDLYCKATKHLYDDAKGIADEKKKEEANNRAYTMSAKPRYLFGFINLEDGSELIVDLTKKQAAAIIKSIQKYEKKLEKTAFELSKSGTGQATVVSISPMLDMDEDLSTDEQKHWNSSKGKTISDEVFENVLQFASDEQQVKDLLAFGFDVSRFDEPKKVAETHDEGAEAKPPKKQKTKSEPDENTDLPLVDLTEENPFD